MIDEDASWPEDDQLDGPGDEVAEGATPGRRSWPQRLRRSPTPQGPPAALLAPDGLPAGRMRGNEPIISYAAAAVAVVCAVILLVDRTGAGAPAHPTPIWASIGVVGGLAMAITVRFQHRLVTASVALLTGFTISEARGPTSLIGLRDLGFFVPALCAMYLYIRQTSADRARRKAGLGPARGGRSTSTSSSAAATDSPRVPTGGTGRPSGRYTPPKDRSPEKSSGAKRR